MIPGIVVAAWRSASSTHAAYTSSVVAPRCRGRGARNKVKLNMNGRLTFDGTDPVRFGSDRFLSVVAGVYT
jgi:hypothetical protein